MHTPSIESEHLPPMINDSIPESGKTATGPSVKPKLRSMKKIMDLN